MGMVQADKYQELVAATGQNENWSIMQMYYSLDPDRILVERMQLVLRTAHRSGPRTTLHHVFLWPDRESLKWINIFYFCSFKPKTLLKCGI
jgi:hypothetical protein